MKKYFYTIAIVFGLLYSGSVFSQSLWDDIGSNNITNINTGNVIIGNHGLGGPSNILTIKNAAPANALLNSFYTGMPASPQTLGAFRILNSGAGEPNHQFFMGMRKLPGGDFDLVQSVFVAGTESPWKEFSAFVMSTQNYEIRGGINDFLIKNSGRVTIGYDNPPEGSYALALNGDLTLDGKLTSTEVEVKADVWPDFVFDNDYVLRSLYEVEEFILTNRHLPDVPSEAEVLQSGVKLGEMSAILLQKVEELTLYLIELDKQNRELQQRVAELEK